MAIKPHSLYKKCVPRKNPDLLSPLPFTHCSSCLIWFSIIVWYWLYFDVKLCSLSVFVLVHYLRFYTPLISFYFIVYILFFDDCPCKSGLLDTNTTIPADLGQICVRDAMKGDVNSVETYLRVIVPDLPGATINFATWQVKNDFQKGFWGGFTNNMCYLECYLWVRSC